MKAWYLIVGVWSEIPELHVCRSYREARHMSNNPKPRRVEAGLYEMLDFSGRCCDIVATRDGIMRNGYGWVFKAVDRCDHEFKLYNTRYGVSEWCIHCKRTRAEAADDDQ